MKYTLKLTESQLRKLKDIVDDENAGQEAGIDCAYTSMIANQASKDNIFALLDNDIKSLNKTRELQDVLYKLAGTEKHIVKHHIAKYYELNLIDEQLEKLFDLVSEELDQEDKKLTNDLPRHRITKTATGIRYDLTGMDTSNLEILFDLRDMIEGCF